MTNPSKTSVQKLLNGQNGEAGKNRKRYIAPIAASYTEKLALLIRTEKSPGAKPLGITDSKFMDGVVKSYICYQLSQRDLDAPIEDAYKEFMTDGSAIFDQLRGQEDQKWFEILTPWGSLNLSPRFETPAGPQSLHQFLLLTIRNVPNDAKLKSVITNYVMTSLSTAISEVAGLLAPSSPGWQSTVTDQPGEIRVCLYLYDGLFEKPDLINEGADDDEDERSFTPWDMESGDPQAAAVQLLTFFASESLDSFLEKALDGFPLSRAVLNQVDKALQPNPLQALEPQFGWVSVRKSKGDISSALTKLCFTEDIFRMSPNKFVHPRLSDADEATLTAALGKACWRLPMPWGFIT